MKTHLLVVVAACSLCGLIAQVGCGRSPVAADSAARASVAEVDRSLILSQEPPGAISVANAKRIGKDGQQVAVVGWIAGSEQPIIQGRAAFTIVDLELPPLECAATPYSFCCMAKETLLPNLIMVKFVDDHGATLTKDARTLLGIKEGDVVVVQGRLQCHEDGTVSSIIAEKVFLRGPHEGMKSTGKTSHESQSEHHAQNVHHS